MKILLADDDSEQLLMRSMLLSQSGFDTVQAHDCESAIRMARTERPACAVVDLRFPTEELGLRTVRELKALDPAIHVLLLTGGHSDRLARMPEAALVDEILVKGNSWTQLMQSLQSLRVDRDSPKGD
jgi:two-component system, OmpR family, KDP operon response regulator KdpE